MLTKKYLISHCRRFRKAGIRDEKHFAFFLFPVLFPK